MMKEKTKKPKLPRLDRRQARQAIPHYVCTGGCGFVSNKLEKCPTPGCWRYRNPLTECRCKNGKHGKLPTRNVPK